MNGTENPATHSGNVVSIFSNKSQKGLSPSPEVAAPAPAPATSHDFEQELRRNREQAEKLRKDREKANQSVLRSYKIKT